AKGVERISRAAFEWAQDHGKTRVTMSDKANAVPAHRIWQETFRRVAAELTGIDAEHRYVDALAMELVREPERFQAIVTNNLYGDILSDLGLGLVGGLGLAATARPLARHLLRAADAAGPGSRSAAPCARLHRRRHDDRLGHVHGAGRRAAAIRQRRRRGVGGVGGRARARAARGGHVR